MEYLKVTDAFLGGFKMYTNYSSMGQCIATL
jgi:hypothetical protein